jgi:hypothetical protein
LAISATATAFGTARPVAVTVTTREVEAPVSDCGPTRSRAETRGVVRGGASSQVGDWMATHRASVGGTEGGIWKAHLQSVDDVRHVVPNPPRGLDADLVPVHREGRDARVPGLGHRLGRTRTRGSKCSAKGSS